MLAIRKEWLAEKLLMAEAINGAGVITIPEQLIEDLDNEIFGSPKWAKHKDIILQFGEDIEELLSKYAEKLK